MSWGKNLCSYFGLNLLILILMIVLSCAIESSNTKYPFKSLDLEIILNLGNLSHNIKVVFNLLIVISWYSLKN